MTVKELREELNNPGFKDDDEVVIVIKEPSMGATPSTNITGTFHGFDWDAGKVLIYTEDNLRRD